MIKFKKYALIFTLCFLMNYVIFFPFQKFYALHLAPFCMFVVYLILLRLVKKSLTKVNFRKFLSLFICYVSTKNQKNYLDPVQ